MKHFKVLLFMIGTLCLVALAFLLIDALTPKSLTTTIQVISVAFATVYGAICTTYITMMFKEVRYGKEKENSKKKSN